MLSLVTAGSSARLIRKPQRCAARDVSRSGRNPQGASARFGKGVASPFADILLLSLPMNDRQADNDAAAKARVRARTLMKAGWRSEAISLLQQAAYGDADHDAGVRIDLVEALLAAGRIEEAEAVRLPGTDH
ncbi:tetratricopeptide repeat protein [Thalassobaculum sp.]|uniref:tetratricopeptide repeat protein n=1 Tax=Thalassobaculum sp. TaxID=2022740 RepID=UPI0032F09075